MRRCEFFIYIYIYSVDLLHYNLHKISLNSGGSYIDYLKWLKNKNRNNKSKQLLQKVLSICCNIDIQILRYSEDLLAIEMKKVKVKLISQYI